MLTLPPGQGFSIYSIAAVLPLLAAKQRPTHRQRLDDQRQRSRLPGSQLSEPPAHQARGAQALSAAARRPQRASSPRASHERRRDLRTCAGLRDLARHPRRLAACRRPWSDRSRHSARRSDRRLRRRHLHLRLRRHLYRSRGAIRRDARAPSGDARDRSGEAASGSHQIRAGPRHSAHASARRDVARIVDRSLRRLKVDTLDLVQFHWWDYAEAALAGRASSAR